MYGRLASDTTAKTDIKDKSLRMWKSNLKGKTEAVICEE